jgi:hypothetical protein
MRFLIIAFLFFLTHPTHQVEPPIFRMSANDFWLNLHQFLYVLGRAENNAFDMNRRAVANAPKDQAEGLSTLSAADQQIWRAAVATYANGPSKLDAVFDASLIKIGNLLEDAAAPASLESAAAAGLDPVVRAALERAAPIYRKAWWPAHARANQAWMNASNDLVAADGAKVLAFITGAYGQTWPANGYPVHVVGYANWAGAFSTEGDLLMISSLDAEIRGVRGMEITFHEAMHQWDPQMDALFTAEAKSQGKTLPDTLTHALIFFTAGEAVRRVVPGYVPYAEANGNWRGRLGENKPAIDAAWLPYLDGKSTRAQAITALVQLTGK